MDGSTERYRVCCDALEQLGHMSTAGEVHSGVAHSLHTQFGLGVAFTHAWLPPQLGGRIGQVQNVGPGKVEFVIKVMMCQRCSRLMVYVSVIL